MRIAIVTEVFLPKIDGVVTRLTRTLEQLAEMGHEVLIFATGDAPATYAGFEVVRIPSFSFRPVYPEIQAGLPSPRVMRRLREFDPDVVHAVNPIWTAGFFSLRAARQGFPILASFHTDVPEYTRKLGIAWVRPIATTALKRFHGRAQVNMVTSGPMLEKAKEYGIHNVELWPKAVDTQGFSPEKRTTAMRKRLTGGHPDAPLVTFMGRISAEKSVDRLVGIMEAVRATHPTASLALIGAGPQYEELRSTMARDWITFTGYLSGRELQEAYATGDVLAFPSTTETLGFAALEAFASGVPVVGARAGGIPFVIDDGKTGFLVDPELPDAAWAEPIGQLLSDAALRQRMAHAAREEALRWSWRASTEALVEQYAQVIERAQAKS